MHLLSSVCIVLEAEEAGRDGDFKILLVGFAQLLYLILDVGVSELATPTRRCVNLSSSSP